MTLDKRLHAYRDDLADIKLQLRVSARIYVEGVPRQIIVPVAGVHKSADATSMQLSQALFGEQVKVFDESKGFAFVQLKHDGYVGYVKSDALGAVTKPNHKVSAPSTLLYPKPDLKTQPARALPQGAGLTVQKVEGNYAALASGGYVFANHIAKLKSVENDFVAVAERYYSVPYLWGGKTFAGLDCSGLVQVALHACGIKCPRDSDMQERDLGRAVTSKKLKRGDLIFWNGHVGIMRDAETLLHANGHHMMVAEEKLSKVIKRITTPVTAIKRL